MIDGDDLQLFERSLRHATETATGPALDATLDELGWFEALTEDPRAAVSLLFELQGRATASSSAVAAVLLDALGRPGRDGTIVLPALGRWDPPGRLDGDRLTVAGLAVVGLDERESALVVARAGEGVVGLTVPVSALLIRAVQGIDPDLGLIEVTAEALPVDVTAAEAIDGWVDGVARAQVALGHELVGASRRMLELAREHALQREQFGQLISAFQAIRHRLADTLVAIETADSVLDAAWLDRSPDTAAMAKALAGRGARTASRHCQQVLAGIGFTTEHPLHLSIRRVLVLDQLLGSSRALTLRLGQDLVAERRLPPLLPL